MVVLRDFYMWLLGASEVPCWHLHVSTYHYVSVMCSHQSLPPLFSLIHTSSSSSPPFSLCLSVSLSLSVGMFVALNHLIISPPHTHTPSLPLRLKGWLEAQASISKHDCKGTIAHTLLENTTDHVATINGFNSL